MLIQADTGPMPAAPLLRCDLPSQIGLKSGIIDLILATIETCGDMQEEVGRWLRLALEELVTNAMVHGHEGDPDLLITVHVWHEGSLWHIRIDDDGDGFDESCIPDPDDPESLLLERGRGIRIATHGVRQLQYFRGGRSVVVTVNTDSPE